LPLTAFGWPNVNSDEFKTFFPTDLLETGHDIIFFWVARMVFMSYFFMDTLPFHTVYLHPIVRDAEGRKMSKSLGNVIDPLEVINGITLDDLVKKLYEGNLPESELKRSADERKKVFPDGIPECGADALRLGLMSYLVQGRNINLDISRVISFRFFGNKLWNATKFLLSFTTNDFKLDRNIKPVSFIDKWILNKLARVTATFNKSFDNYSFGDATMAIYSFWQDCICDVYIEALKTVLPGDYTDEKNTSKNILLRCIDYGLKILHPLMPFVTEELYQRLPKEETDSESICIAQFPEDTTYLDDGVELQGERILDITHKVLSVLSQFGIAKIKPKIAIYSEDKVITDLLRNETLLIATLTKCSSVAIVEKRDAPEVQGWLVNVVNSTTDVFLDVSKDIDITKEIERLNGSLKEKLKYIDEINSKITKPGYDKVPEDIKQTNSEKLQKAKIELEKLESSLTQLKALNK
jgi:valyl-tRNA synthetase